MRRKVSVSMDRSAELKSKQNINKLLLNESLPSQITDSAIVSEIISRLEMKYGQLSLRYQQLSTKFEKIDELAQEAVWQYSVATSNDFRCIPLMVTDLVENESRIGEYGVEKVLRKGAYSTVKCCIKCEGSEQTITKYVVKTIPKENIHHMANAIMVNTEIRALMTLSGHMGVVGFVEAIHTPSHVHIATEWFPCDLFEFMSAHHSALNEKIVSVIMRKLLLGVEFLHSHRIVHRDIKPENILIAFNNQKEMFVKICDFGLCEFMPAVSVTASVQGVSGSRGFFAPESITCSAGYCGFKADLFSVGCVCLEMLASPSFFSAQWMAAYEAAATSVPECYLYEKAIHRVILKAAQEMNARHPLCVSEFIAGALNILPAARFNLTEMMFCRWLCVAERLEKPSNIGAHFDFMNPNSVGRVSGTYAPTANCSDSECLRAMREFSAAKDKTVKQHLAESETSVEKLITLRDKILRSDSHNRSPLTGSHRSGLELNKSPADCTLSGTDGDAESGGDGSSCSSVASSVSRPDSDESSLMVMAMKRVALPGTHIILSPLAATSSSLTSTDAAKMLPHHTIASARQSPSVYFDQSEVGSPGKKILSAVRSHNLPTKHCAVRSTQTSSKSPPRNSSESCQADSEAAHITMLDRNQQYLSQDSVTGIKFAPVNKPAPPRITAAQLSDESADTSCGYLAQLEHQAARDAYRPTQAFERIQARMMLRDGDHHSKTIEQPATKRVPHLPTPAKEKDVNLYNCTMIPLPPKPVSVSKPGGRIAGTQRHKAGQPIRFG